MKKNKWDNFIHATENRTPFPFVVEAVKNTPIKGYALDLGCGAGVDAEYMRSAGYTVDAIDSSPAAKATWRGDIRKFQIVAGKYKLIISINALPFIPKKDVFIMLRNMATGLSPGGTMVLSVFGKRDDWKNKISTLSVSEIKKYTLNIAWGKIRDKDFDGFDYKGKEKHWHIILMVGKKS